METTDGSAGNGDEAKWKQFARNDGPRAVDKGGEGGHLEDGQHQQHAGGQGEDGAELHEGAEVVSRREQQPDRQHARGETVEHNRPGQGFGREGEEFGERWVAVDPLTSPDRSDQQEDAERRALQGFAGPDIPQVKAHEQRDGDGCSDRENAPWTFGEHLYDNQSEHRQKDDHDRQDRHQGQCTQEGIQFVLHHLT